MYSGSTSELTFYAVTNSCISLHPTPIYYFSMWSHFRVDKGWSVTHIWRIGLRYNEDKSSGDLSITLRAAFSRIFAPL